MKIKLSYRKAVRECKRLWEAIGEIGNKQVFLSSPAGESWRGKYFAACPLCHYLYLKRLPCSECPLIIQYGERCSKLGYSLNNGIGNSNFQAAIQHLEESKRKAIAFRQKGEKVR